jgi:hypothetical protein
MIGSWVAAMSSNRDNDQEVFRETWHEHSLALNRFLESNERILLLKTNKFEKSVFRQPPGVTSLNADLLQFCSLRTFQRGELGIRELHWLTSEFLIKSRLLRFILIDSALNKSKRLSTLIQRYQRMLNRKEVNDALLVDLEISGTVIPNYVEPQESNLIISRDFAEALLEFNSEGYLTLQRACFALARSSSFQCFRITRVKN